MTGTVPLRQVCPATGPGVSELPTLIGHTPLMRLRRVGPDNPRVEVYVKAEWFNPGGSVKDRTALRIVQTAMAEGKLAPGGWLIDATSGNTGIAYAMLGAALGFRVRLCVPANANAERRRILSAYGAHLELTDPLKLSDGAIIRALEIVGESPNEYFHGDQYNNPANWLAHFETTGPEIWRQTEGRVTHFITGLGTTGTFMGVGRYLRQQNDAVRLIGLQPSEPLHGLEGLKHLETSIVPGIYDPGLADEQRTVATEDAWAMCRRVAREEGLFVGISSGAAIHGALQLASQLSSGVIVTVLPDGGARYLMDRLWDPD